jgi:hypothetical protein
LDDLFSLQLCEEEWRGVVRFPWTNYSITQQEKAIFNLLRQVYLEVVQRDRFTRLDLPINGIVDKAFEVVDAFPSLRSHIT